MSTAKHVLGSVVFIGIFLYGGYDWFWDNNMKSVKEVLIESNQAMASEIASFKGVIPKARPTEETLSKQQARDIQFMIANFLYETMGYSDSPNDQEEAFRVIATSVINKKAFEKHKSFEAVITEKNPNCQYSWYCEKGKSVDLKHLQKTFKEAFPVAFKVATDVVLGGFVPLAYNEEDRFDGVYYATTESYKSKNSWHRREVQAGRQCKRRTIDGHVYTAPKIKGSCKTNQFAYFGE